MSDGLSEDAMRARYEAAMGSELGATFAALSRELTWLRWRWSQYTGLFAQGPERVALLNDSARTFFFIVQHVLWEDTLLGISRLAGPVKTMDKENLSVHQLGTLIAEDPLKSTVMGLLKEVKAKTAFAKDWRNRHIAHRDLALATSRAAEPLAAASRASVEAALRSLALVLNRVEDAFLHTTTAYSMNTLIFDAESLAYVLADGLRHGREREARIALGDVRPEDLE